MTRTGSGTNPRTRPSNTGARRLRTAFAVLAAADALLAANGRTGARRLTKPALMPLLAASSPADARVPLAAGTAGDTALLGSSDAAFRAGLGSFLLGHVAWVRTLRARGSGAVLAHRPVAAAPYVVAWAGLNAWLWRRTGPDRAAVLVYSAALAATALAALDTGDRTTAVGGALFLASDTLLALEKFGDVTLPGHEGLVMATYTAAQALLAGRA